MLKLWPLHQVRELNDEDCALPNQYWRDLSRRAPSVGSVDTSAFASPLVLRQRKSNLPARLDRGRKHVLRCCNTAPARLAPQSHALRAGTWFKMICGASSQDLPRIRNLAMLYAFLGVDCIDVAADPAVVTAVREGFSAAKSLRARRLMKTQPDPWLMVSVNDDEDPHFRKATFETASCPSDCPRPCERICPANAIDATGVIADICYGCGRCIPVCPENLVAAVPFVHTSQTIVDLLSKVDALEIHTRAEHSVDFVRLWDAVGETANKHMKLVAVSFPDPGSEARLSKFLMETSTVLSKLPTCTELVWQTDGRPMSGDIGRGTANAAVRLGGRVRDALNRDGITGHVQLAGGTNDATVPLLEEAGLFSESRLVAGIAFGGYARKIVSDVLDELQARGVQYLEDDIELLENAISKTAPLVKTLKGRCRPAEV